jgi:D-tagatose-1,6-bisphosphate aldolase subunit GatZ/KbaZ
VRYYWTAPAVEAAVADLIGFLDARPLPLPLISQYLPQHVRAVAAGALAATAAALCSAHVQRALAPYADACGSYAGQMTRP